MASRQYYMIASSNITSDADLLPCMAGHHRDYTELNKNRFPDFGTELRVTVKCNCDDPATEHAGTYLDGETSYNHADIMVEMAKVEWADPDGL